MRELLVLSLTVMCGVDIGERELYGFNTAAWRHSFGRGQLCL